MKKTTALPLQLLVVCTLAGASYAIGRFTAEPKIETLPEKTTTRTIAVKDATDATALAKAFSDIDALKAENTRLKEELANVDTLPVDEGVAPPQTEAPEQPRRQSWRERMDELREKDPERYAAEMERRQNFANAMEQLRSDRVNFLDSIDTSLLSDEAQATHERFVTALARQGELQREMMAAFESGEQPSEELRTQMRETVHELHATQESERVALLDAIAVSMGLENEAVTDFTQLVNEVFNATNGQMMQMRPPRGGRGPNMMP